MFSTLPLVKGLRQEFRYLVSDSHESILYKCFQFQARHTLGNHYLTPIVKNHSILQC